MDFWDFYPDKIDLLLNYVKKDLERILGKKISCERLYLWNYGLYCITGDKKWRLLTLKKLERRLREFQISDDTFYELLYLYNTTHSYLENYKYSLEFVSKRWGKDHERILRLSLFKKSRKTSVYTLFFFDKLKRYIPDAGIYGGYYIKHEVLNKERCTIRLWVSKPAIDVQGSLIPFLELKHLGKIRVKDLSKFENLKKAYHSILYLFVFKEFLKPVIESYLKKSCL